MINHSQGSDTVNGCLLGMAVGDAIGLPVEGLTPRRRQRLFGSIDGHRLLRGRGMVSDDTEHACLVAQALIASGGDPALFERDLARRLRRWFLLLPAGVGKATAVACLRLLCGIGPDRSGIFSAGNGPAMRSALIGVCAGDDPARLRALVRASARITHTDPKAEYGAYAVALAAHLAATQAALSPQEYVASLGETLGDDARELLDLIACAADSRDLPTTAFAAKIGQARGVSGYVNRTVPVALHAWFRHGDDYHDAVLEVVRCGGDTDTTAAIVGGIVGARVGKAGIPSDWLAGLCDRPCTVEWMENLGSVVCDARASGERAAPPRLPIPETALRNLFFLGVVLYHGFRRLLPPY